MPGGFPPVPPVPRGRLMKDDSCTFDGTVDRPRGLRRKRPGVPLAGAALPEVGHKLAVGEEA